MKKGGLSLYNILNSSFKSASKSLMLLMKDFKSLHKSNKSEKKINKFLFKAFGSLIEKYSNKIFKKELYNKLNQPLQMIEAESTKEFMKVVNKHVGISRKKIIKQDKLTDFMKTQTQENANLITNMSQEYLNRANSIVTKAFNAGKAPSAIEKDLQEQLPNVNAKRAKLIARDQYAKITAQVAKKRAKQANIKYFYYQTAKDNRVSGKPGGKYPNAKIKCYQISKTDIGYGEGIYTYKDGASWNGETHLFPGTAHINCRCKAVSLIENVTYDPVEKKRI